MSDADSRQVPFYLHALNEADVEAVAAALRQPFLTTGGETAAFEQEFAAYLGVPAAVGVMSGTHALELSLRALGIGPGDEVVTTALSFVATANAIEHVGATTVFADVEPDTGNLSLAAVEAALTPRTAAILPVHLYGLMVDVRGFQELAHRHGLALVEDAAHCLEGERDGFQPGQAADAAGFSFYATKNLTCGEGGAITCRDEDLAARLRTDRLHGMSRDGFDRHSGGLYQHYDVPRLGWKSNLPNILATLLRSQLPRLPEMLAARERLAQRYETAFADLPGVDSPRSHLPHSRHARHLFTIWVPPDRRDWFLHELQQRGVGCTVNYRAIPQYSYYADKYGWQPGQFPEAERIGESTITLPLYPALTDDDQDYVIAQVTKLAHARPG